MRLAQSVLVILLWLFLGFAPGCRSCSESTTLATLEQKEGVVDRDTRDKQKEWMGATIGATFSMGDAVRTREEASALLALDDGSRLKVRSKTILRFSDRPPTQGEQGFDIEAGEAMLEASQAGLVLRTSLGLARIDGNSQVLLRRTQRGVRFEVHVGKAVLETKDGKSEVAQGSGIVVGVGAAVIERVSLEPERAPEPETPPEPEPEPEQPLEDIKGDIAGQVEGAGVSLMRPNDKRFTPLAPGEVNVPSGSTVKVRRGSTLRLQQGQASAALAGTGTYLVGGKGGTLVQVQQGSVSLSGGRTRVVVPGGVIVTSPGSAAAIDLVQGGARVRVSKNQVQVEGAQGSEQVRAGQEAVLAKDGAIKLQGKGLGYADISVGVGESFVVHDPGPPTAVRFQFRGACPGGGVIRVKSKDSGQFASGTGSVALAFQPGRHNYSLHCLEDGGIAKASAAEGSLTVLRDAGTRPVPKKPPATGVETDGRTYTVMYQNQLPSVSLRWSKAPSAGSFSLVHHSRAGQKNYSLSSPSYSFRSGRLPEGRHVFYFEGGGRVSRQTTVNIKFDNAAPTASLKTPVGLKAREGDQVTIAGVAQPGWSVEINGKSANLDGQQRFSQKAEMPKGERALAVRLTHPHRGTHIYVRRAAGTDE